MHELCWRNFICCFLCRLWYTSCPGHSKDCGWSHGSKRGMALGWKPPIPKASPLRGHARSQQVADHCSTLLQEVFLWNIVQKNFQIHIWAVWLLLHSDSSPTNWAVSLGSVLRSGVGALIIPIQRVIIHPAFNSSSMDHDVALVELAVPAPMSYTIQSVCLPSPVHLFLKTAQCYITGWGSMREGGERNCWHHTDRTLIEVIFLM